MNEDARIADALERIADALERLLPKTAAINLVATEPVPLGGRQTPIDPILRDKTDLRENIGRTK